MGAHVLISVLAASAVTIALAMTVTALAARRVNRVAVVDVTWGLGFVLVAVVTALVATALDEGCVSRRWLLVGLVAIWGGRLAWHIRRRALGAHAGAEDPRYEKMLGGTLDRVGLAVAVRRVFAVQGVALFVISAPVAVGTVSDVDYTWAVVAGVVVWLIGLAFEAIGDAQLAAYKEIPKEQRPQVMETGLWRYTRHPNYFGDATVWWGLWLVAGLGSGWAIGLATVLAPVFMTFFLVNATGAKLLERTMMQRPGYPEYAARTSMFFPLPPKK
ncbi:MAG: DUF1295 domain-containing protein [Nocardioides sp.]